MDLESIPLPASLVLWAAGWLLARRLRPVGVTSAAGTPPGVSIIVPARNEEHNLPALLSSLATQAPKPSEVIVVDDGSTDRTAEVARQHGARVIASQPLPEGWRGKTWACHQGAQAAAADLLLFVDADTWFEPNGLARILAAYASGLPEVRQSALISQPADSRRSAEPPRHSQLGVFSVGPFHHVRRAYEDLSLFFNFTMAVGTVPDGLFGQMLLVDRESYRRVGGYEAVRGRTLENFFLARQFRAANIPTASVTGRGVFSFRMYPNSLRELVEGWTKGFASGAGQTPQGVLLLVVAWMIGLMLAPTGLLVTGGSIQWGAVYLLCAAQVAWLSRQIGTFRSLSALAYPVPLIFFFAIFARSRMRSGRQVTWKGREIRAD